MIIFDLINSILKWWFRLEVCFFNSAVDTNLFKNIFKQSDSIYIYCSGGDHFKMIFFDPINSIFKCWPMF